MEPPARRGVCCSHDRAAYRNSGQQTIPAAKIIMKVQKSFFFIVGQLSQKGGLAKLGGGSARPVPRAHDWGETVSGTVH